MNDERLRWRVSPPQVLVMIPLLPLFPLWVKRRARQVPALQQTREIHLIFTIAPLIILTALVPIAQQQRDTRVTWLLWAMGGAFLYSVFLGRRFATHQLPPQVRSRARDRVPSRLLLQAAFAMSVAMWGFVAVFITGQLWPYLAGMPVALVWLWAVGPTATNIERKDTELRAKGSPLSLVAALLAPPRRSQSDEAS